MNTLKCHPVTVHVPTHPQAVIISKYFILGTPTQPLNIHKMSPCHCTYTHPPIEHIQTVIMSKSFILQTATHSLNISKVSPCHCTNTHPCTNRYNIKIFHFRNTHPPTHQTYPNCHPVTVNIPTHPPITQTVMVKIFHFSNIHPPMGVMAGWV